MRTRAQPGPGGLREPARLQQPGVSDRHSGLPLKRRSLGGSRIRICSSLDMTAVKRDTLACCSRAPATTRAHSRSLSHTHSHTRARLEHQRQAGCAHGGTRHSDERRRNCQCFLFANSCYLISTYVCLMKRQRRGNNSVHRNHFSSCGRSAHAR